MDTLVVCLLVAGCDDSTNPLSNPDKSSPDEQLIGTWRQKNETNPSYYHVGRLGGEAPEGVMRVVSCAPSLPALSM